MKIIFVIMMLSALPAWAHGGEDHGDETAPTPLVAAAPRAVAESDAFELVVVPVGGKLRLYLDRHASNEPVADARIELESGAFLATAEQVSPGTYELPGEHFAAPGKYPLTISVQAGEDADLLATMLDTPQTAGAADAPRPWGRWAAWAGLGATLPAMGVFFVWRKRRLAHHDPKNPG